MDTVSQSIFFGLLHILGHGGMDPGKVGVNNALEKVQTQLIKSLKPQKERVAKDNGSYYLLKKTSVPIMIIECAFMSNPTEAELLVQENYQEKVAWAIYMGIMQALNANE